jgi:hypothetical protein
VGKTVLIVAPIIVGVAVLWLAFALGKVVQRVQTAVAASHISPGVHEDLREVVRALLSPTDLSNPPYLPAALKQQAELALKNADDNAASVKRAERRRAGY